MSLLDDLIEEADDFIQEPSKEKVFAFDCVRSNPYFFGHEKAEDLFLKLYQKKELPHAWIFTGPKGIGKETFAFRVAKFLFTDSAQEGGGLFGEPEPPVSLDVDFSLPAVQRVISGGHADLFYIQEDNSAKADIKIEKIREVVDFLRKTSAEGGWRIVIINSADRMNNAAQNALLKILEEPPKNTLLILVATTISKLLPTILSRSRVLNFEPLSYENMKKIISLVPDMATDREYIEKIIPLAKGSFGRFQELLNGEAIESFKLLIKGLKNYPVIPRKDMHDISDILGNDKAKANNFIDMACWWVEDIVRCLSLGLERELLLEEEVSFLENLEGQNSVPSLLNLWGKLKELQSDFNWANLDQKTLIMTVFLYFENYKTLEN